MLSVSDIIFDEADRAIVESRTWHPHRAGHVTYARSADRKYLHREIMSAPSGWDVDHINGNGLDVRRANLRIASRSQNNMNRRSQRAGRKGIHFEKQTQRWRAELIVRDVRYRSQRFDTEAEAVAWREEAERHHHTAFAGDGSAQAA